MQVLFQAESYPDSAQQWVGEWEGLLQPIAASFVANASFKGHLSQSVERYIIVSIIFN